MAPEGQPDKELQGQPPPLPQPEAAKTPTLAEMPSVTVLEIRLGVGKTVVGLWEEYSPQMAAIQRGELRARLQVAWQMGRADHIRNKKKGEEKK